MTPGPETPTLMTASASPVPWTAPAMKGESSTMLAEHDELRAHRTQSASAREHGGLADDLSAMRSTASMLMPARTARHVDGASTRGLVVRERGSGMAS